MEILIPVSLGELYDKISILQIKLNKIKDEQKFKNVINEYNILSKIAEKYPIDSRYKIDLYSINSDIWKLEDDIRKKEKLEEFDKYFISHARNIYEFNDKRAKIKQEINLKYNSDIIEEKSYEK